MSLKILVVEDEPALVGILEFLLTDEGYQVVVAYDGETGLELAKEQKPALVILDVMLPNMSGFEVCNQLRRFTTIPVIILSAKDHDQDVIKGLEIGADDYITKPFNHRELVLRVKKLLSRTDSVAVDEHLIIGDIEINMAQKQVSLKGEVIKLTPTEFKLLTCLAENEDRVLSWESLLREVWQHENWEGGNELVKVNVRRLRKKLENDPSHPAYLINIWGMGYKLTNPK
jgi:DNA-binding response OmpR family regulator|tara:strand:+ start:1657 stop:2343 length:687 start_codon:yes stop_codon:yes gene_type:complete